MLIETEATPNPQTLKFLPGRTVMEAGTRDFATPEEAEASPLADAIFGLGDVTGVFFGRDFVSVTAAPGVDWMTLKPDVLAILLDHFSARMPLFRGPSAAGFSVPPEDDVVDDPADADVVVCHAGLADRARGSAPGKVIVPVQVFIGDPAVTRLVKVVESGGELDG